MSVVAVISGVFQEQLNDDGGYSLVFLGFERILSLKLPSPAAFVEELAAAERITSEEFKGAHAEKLRAHFARLPNNTTRVGPFLNFLHRVDDILTTACNTERQNTLWMGCHSCPAQFTLIFRARIAQDQ